MPDLEEIEVQIDRNGRVRIEVRGVTGKKCETITRDLEEKLGGVIIERDYQDSYYQQNKDESQDDQQDDRA